MAEASHENPLIPHARLRQLARAMLQLRALAKTLPAKVRGGWVAGLEAPLAASSVELGPGDLVSDAVSGGVVRFLRGRALGEVLGGSGTGRGKLKIDCGAASVLAGLQPVEQRLWAALGAAGALKVAAEIAKKTEPTGAEDGALPDSKVFVVYVCAGETPAALWRKLLPVAAGEVLPLIVVVLPPAPLSKRDKVSVSPLALRCGVPGIQVDADDAVAIYRVMQESLVRARMGGGTALIECVPFVLAGAAGKAARRADAVDTIAQYMLTRRVVHKAWMAGEAKSFAARITATQARG